jgi:hypothetical protein
MSPADLLVGLVVSGCEPSPAPQVAGGREPRDIANLGPELRGEHGADAGDGLNGVVAEVAGEVRGDVLLEHGDLAVD